jgi:peptidoglycan/xylan/chitin deacetylase (PgdA/CDA1 family)
MARQNNGVHYRTPQGGGARSKAPLIVYLIVSVLVLAMLAYGIVSVILGSKEQPAASGGSAGGQQVISQVDDKNPSSSEAQGQSAQSSTAGGDGSLAWRDTDFAVDPNRTDWNYSSNGKKTVYLTIDDGPSEMTQQVLDILDKYGCKATFFVVGHNDDYFPMIAEAYKRGHTIGLHTYSHDYAYVYSSTDAYFEDLDEIGQVVKEQIGYVPCFIRFPGGSSNEISASYSAGIMSTLVDQVQDRGYQYYDWNLSVGDGSEHTTEEIIGYGTEGGDEENIMLLCHDSATKQTTVDALPAIIEHYQSLGYTFEAINRDSWVCHHGVNN